MMILLTKQKVKETDDKALPYLRSAGDLCQHHLHAYKGINMNVADLR